MRFMRFFSELSFEPYLVPYLADQIPKGGDGIRSIINPGISYPA